MIGLLRFIAFVIPICGVVSQDDLNYASFPEDFVFGVGTSAYQTEGAWNIDGKGENIWDAFTHKYANTIIDKSNGNTASDSYHAVQEDIDIVRALGVDYYQFSISWSRILPTGTPENINVAGIRHYNKIINLLKKYDISAVVVLYHWDLPQPLQEIGGWTNSSIINAFESYAKIAFEAFGDRVSTWITFYEPFKICEDGYGLARKAPAYNKSGIANYICGHNLLKAHAKTWHLYDEKYRANQTGRVGIVINGPWMEPNSTSEEDEAAAKRGMDFYMGWFAHPIFSDSGDYPNFMKFAVGYRSALEGFNGSRLPSFDEDEVEYIRGTADFFGLSHHATVMAAEKTKLIPIKGNPTFQKDLNLSYFYDGTWPITPIGSFRIVPWGLSKVLSYIREEYNDPEIYVTGNGYPDSGSLNDTGRISFLQEYLSAILNAIDNGVTVKAYTIWSLLDGFEWENGYTLKYGLVQVDFRSKNRTRTLKTSAKFVKHLTDTRALSFGSSAEVLTIVIPNSVPEMEIDERAIFDDTEYPSGSEINEKSSSSSIEVLQSVSNENITGQTDKLIKEIIPLNFNKSKSVNVTKVEKSVAEYDSNIANDTTSSLSKNESLEKEELKEGEGNATEEVTSENPFQVKKLETTEAEQTTKELETATFEGNTNNSEGTIKDKKLRKLDHRFEFKFDGDGEIMYLSTPTTNENEQTYIESTTVTNIDDTTTTTTTSTSNPIQELWDNGEENATAIYLIDIDQNPDVLIEKEVDKIKAEITSEQPLTTTTVPTPINDKDDPTKISFSNDKAIEENVQYEEDSNSPIHNILDETKNVQIDHMIGVAKVTDEFFKN